MTPEGRSYLAKAQEDLNDARKIADIGLAKVAARSAYYAAFHAAEALIFERTGKIAKTHTGVRSEFSRPMKETPNFDRSLTAFLAKAYTFREIGNYGIGPAAIITMEEAEEALAAARQFVEKVTAMLAGAHN